MTRSEVGIVLPPIPAKRYFTIGEVAELCGVKPHVLRYWEQEFTQLRPIKRRGNRRYYQHHEVLLVRRIRELLYEHGFTISGARNRLSDPRAAQQLEESLSLSKSHIRALRADLVELSNWLTSGLEAADAFMRKMSAPGASGLAAEGSSNAGTPVRDEPLAAESVDTQSPSADGSDSVPEGGTTSGVAPQESLPDSESPAVNVSVGSAGTSQPSSESGASAVAPVEPRPSGSS